MCGFDEGPACAFEDGGMDSACWRVKGRGLGALDEELAYEFEGIGSCSACWRVGGRGLGAFDEVVPFENRGMSSAFCRVEGCDVGNGLSFTRGGLSVVAEHGLLARDLFLGDGHVPVRELSSKGGQ